MTVTEATLIPDVLSFFGLGPAAHVAAAGFGISNHNYMVDTEQGEYVVKFLVNQAPEAIENDVAIQRQLGGAGIRAPGYLQDAEGRFLYRHDVMTAVLSRKLDGMPPRHMSPALAADIGQHLALFHTSVQSLPYSNASGPMNPSVAVVDSEPARRLPDQPLPRGIIHGDLHSGNVLVDPHDPDRVVAMLDFEEAGENLYLLDLAVTLMDVGFPRGSDRIDPYQVRAGKRGYETVRPLTEQEEVWLPRAIRYASEAWINWFLANGYERYARQHQRRYDSFEAVIGDHFALWV